MWVRLWAPDRNTHFQVQLVKLPAFTYVLWPQEVSKPQPKPEMKTWRRLDCMKFTLPIPAQARTGWGANQACRANRRTLPPGMAQGDHKHATLRGQEAWVAFRFLWGLFCESKTDSLRKHFKNIYLELHKKYFKWFFFSFFFFQKQESLFHSRLLSQTE